MNLENIKQKEFFPGLKGKLVHGDKITWAFWDVEKGAEVPEHSHHHEQIMHVIDGEFEFILNGNKEKLISELEKPVAKKLRAHIVSK